MKQTIYLVTLSLLICVSVKVKAQYTTSTESSTSKPVWIQMMEDENVNYYEAVAAYESYFKTHPMPGEEVEEELMGADKESQKEYEREMKRENKKIKTDEQRKELVEREQLSYQVKRFRNWMQEVKPFVQENGHILTSSEQYTIWQKQQEEMKNSSGEKK